MKIRQEAAEITMFISILYKVYFVKIIRAAGLTHCEHSILTLEDIEEQAKLRQPQE